MWALLTREGAQARSDKVLSQEGYPRWRKLSVERWAWDLAAPTTKANIVTMGPARGPGVGAEFKGEGQNPDSLSGVQLLGNGSHCKVVSRGWHDLTCSGRVWLQCGNCSV